MGSATSVSICSNALLMVGGQTINSLTDGTSDRQKLAVNLYPTVRDYVLSVHPWNCCRKRVSLSPDASAAGALIVPPYDWSLQYSLPSDFSRMLAVGEDGAEVPYVIESDATGAVKIFCDDNPLLLRYAYLNQNEGSWSALLVMSVTLAMRAILAYPITSSTSLEQLIETSIEGTLKRARAIDGADQMPETLGDFRLLNSRYSANSAPQV